MSKTTFTIILVDDMLVNIKVPNRFFISGSNTKITELLDKLKQIPEYKNVTEITSEIYYDSKTESKIAGVDAIERIKIHETHPIDMIISDLNMTPKDGCDVVKEATIFNIPIYMTSDSLSTFFKDENNSCKTIQNADNELVRGFNDCCNLPNVFGIHKCGKLSIPDIIPLIDKFVEYKLKLNINEKQTIENKLVQNNIELEQTPVKNDESLVPIKTTDSLVPIKTTDSLVPIKTKESWLTNMGKMFSNSSNKVIPVNTGGNNKKNNKNNTKKHNTKKNNTKKNNTKKNNTKKNKKPKSNRKML